MGTPHINANPGDFANVVLMPGDPLRAKLIAEKFLLDYKEVTNVRGILGYTGYTKNGKRLSVMASGMGLPSIGIYSHELFTHYGVDTIIRVGTCGAYQENIKLFDIILGVTASTDSNWANQFNVPQFSAGADFELAMTCFKKAKESGKNVFAGNILSADVFYDDDPDTWKKWAKLNVLGVEMESYGLYCTAHKLRKRALCLLTVTDHFIHKDQKATSEERQNNLLEMLHLGVLTAEEYCLESR
ncbi:MAG: purine-nucleoside phosphorylase [Bacilli bacterium]|nr:purine-nucleoside phosphorylase [Bacilli bacterium]